MDLRACPGCGREDPHDGCSGMNPAAKRVVCLGCGFQAPSIKTWNTRADEAIRREVIEECAKVIDSMFERSIGYLNGIINKEQASAMIRALADPLPESRSVVPDAKERNSHDYGRTDG